MHSDLNPTDNRRETPLPLLSVDGLSVRFPIRRGMFGRHAFLHALDDVSLSVHHGETVALVGESGSGKTTLGYTVLGHHTATSGSVFFEGRDITHCGRSQLRSARRQMQMIFQDPYSALNPRMRVGETIGEPLLAHGLMRDNRQRRRRVGELLELCGLSADVANRYPHAFSGGQRQRIIIARALALSPKLIVADEPTSALDVSVQAQIINLLRALQESLSLSYLFISHDLSIVRHIAQKIVILYAGRVVETGTVDEIFTRPLHPYTKALLSAIPIPDPDWRSKPVVGSGEAPSAIDPTPGCRFVNRCPIATPRCTAQSPPLEAKDASHNAACWEVPIEAKRAGTHNVQKDPRSSR